MNIVNTDRYETSIYRAIVVNTDTSQDPEFKYRIQVYVPFLQYEYNDIYKNYINNPNKAQSDDKDKFPWAISLVPDLKEGNIVYISFINNDINQYIILGLDAYNPANQDSGSDGYLANGQDLLNLAMPIILHNEIGMDINAWPDNISNEAFIKINPFDKGCSCLNPSTCPHSGGWSIGLIQWHHARAYDCCFEIAKNDGEWENRFTDKSCQLYLDLKQSIFKDSSAQQRNKYGANFHPTTGTALYQSIQNLLGSEKGKEIQKQYASSETQNSITNLQSSSYNIQNPAIIIFLVDIMNQYGSNLPETKQNASKISNNGKSIMEQFEEFVTYCKKNLGNYNTYKNRRDDTYSYIIELNKQGKFNTSTLTDLGATGGGQYCIPFIGRFKITAGFGHYPSGSKHSGVDFACPNGTTLVACTNATVYAAGPSGSGYGTYVRLTGDDGNTIIYGHMRQVVVSKGQKVTKGQVIGYSDNTGNSTGPHLHFEIRPKGGGSGEYGSTNPLPYIGVNGFGDGEGVGTYIGG